MRSPRRNPSRAAPSGERMLICVSGSLKSAGKTRIRYGVGGLRSSWKLTSRWSATTSSGRAASSQSAARRTSALRKGATRSRRRNASATSRFNDLCWDLAMRTSGCRDCIMMNHRKKVGTGKQLAGRKRVRPATSLRGYAPPDWPNGDA